MALLGTSANVSAMDLIGTSTVIANIATVAANVAGVNSFAERYRVGSSDPSSSLMKEIYFIILILMFLNFTMVLHG